MSRMQLEGAAETEAERLLDRDVEKAKLLELLRSLKRAYVDRPQAGVRHELRELLFRALVVCGDQDVELLAVDLARNEGRREGRVERLHDRGALRDELGDLLGGRGAGRCCQPVPRLCVDGIRDVDDDSACEPIGVLLDGLLDARVVEGK